MRERPEPLGHWQGHVLGILTEAGYVAALFAAAALVAWVVTLR